MVTVMKKGEGEKGGGGRKGREGEKITCACVCTLGTSVSAMVKNRPMEGEREREKVVEGLNDLRQQRAGSKVTSPQAQTGKNGVAIILFVEYFLLLLIHCTPCGQTLCY